eukprot:scaffold162913_cov36-Tisochrysis_lutea.AAC.2
MASLTQALISLASRLFDRRRETRFRSMSMSNVLASFVASAAVASSGGGNESTRSAAYETAAWKRRLPSAARTNRASAVRRSVAHFSASGPDTWAAMRSTRAPRAIAAPQTPLSREQRAEFR